MGLAQGHTGVDGRTRIRPRICDSRSPHLALLSRDIELLVTALLLHRLRNFLESREQGGGGRRQECLTVRAEGPS